MEFLTINSLSIRHRLLLIIFSVCFVSVVVTAVASTAFSIYAMRDNMGKELELSASVIGDRNRSAIAFGRPDVVTSNLEILKYKPSIISACVYNAVGKVFAIYPINSNKKKHNCPKVKEKYTEFKGKILETMQPIMLRKNRPVGTIYIASDLRNINDYIVNHVIVVIIITIIVLMIAYFMSKILQKSISDPILNLSETALCVSINKDYSARAVIPESNGGKKSASEITTLIQAFNEMLSEIEIRNDTLKRKNKELELAKEQAEGANIAKSSFLAGISHELRTPLNAIIGFSSIIQSQLFGSVNDKYLEYAVDINESGQHLLEIINDILDISKAEAGKLTLELEEFNLEKSIKKCLKIIETRANEANITISTEIDAKMPYMVADRVRIIQILINLLSNAVKFTEEGGSVTVIASSQPVGGNKSLFTIKIADTGIGMSPEDIEQAMQSFGQIDNGLNRKYEGTGLGIPLTQRLVELHKGSMQIESKLGVGTIISVKIISDLDII